VSNYTSAPRRGETEVGVKFFESMGYKVAVPPTKFEGEAELKHLHDNIYVGGYGIRSEKETYDWMERNYDMRIIKVGMSDPYLYHLDGLIFPITSQDTLVCTKMFTRKEVSALEKVTNIISVTPDESYSGICNCVRLPHVVLNSTYISTSSPERRNTAKSYRRTAALRISLAIWRSKSPTSISASSIRVARFSRAWSCT
jgi:N-dimethylarginine dimethylaminohydrolase